MNENDLINLLAEVRTRFNSLYNIKAEYEKKLETLKSNVADEFGKMNSWVEDGRVDWENKVREARLNYEKRLRDLPIYLQCEKASIKQLISELRYITDDTEEEREQKRKISTLINSKMDAVKAKLEKDLSDPFDSIVFADSLEKKLANLNVFDTPQMETGQGGSLFTEREEPTETGVDGSTDGRFSARNSCELEGNMQPQSICRTKSRIAEDVEVMKASGLAEAGHAEPGCTKTASGNTRPIAGGSLISDEISASPPGSKGEGVARGGTRLHVIDRQIYVTGFDKTCGEVALESLFSEFGVELVSIRSKAAENKLFAFITLSSRDNALLAAAQWNGVNVNGIGRLFVAPQDNSLREILGIPPTNIPYNTYTA